MQTNNSAPEAPLNNPDPSEQVKFWIAHFREMMKQLFVNMDASDTEKPLLLTENLSDLSRDEIVQYCLINLNNQFLSYMKQAENSPTPACVLDISYKLVFESINKLMSDIKEQHPSEYYTKLKTCLPLLTDNFHQSRYELPLISSTLCAIAKHSIYKIELAAPICKELFRIEALLSPTDIRGKRRNALRIHWYKKLKEQGISDAEIFNEIICAENHGKTIAKDDLLKKQNSLRKWKHDNKKKLEKELKPVEIEDVTVTLVPKATAVVASQKETATTFINLLWVILEEEGEKSKLNDHVVECFLQEWTFINKHLNDDLYLLFSYGIIGYIATELCYVRLKLISEMYEDYLREKKELEHVNALIPNLAEKRKLYSSATQNGKKTNKKLIEDMVAAEYASKNIENANAIIPSDIKTARENTLKRQFKEIQNFAEKNETPKEKKASDIEAAHLDTIFSNLGYPKKSSQKRIPSWENALEMIQEKDKQGPKAKFSDEEYLKEMLVICERGIGWKNHNSIPLKISLSQLQRKFKFWRDKLFFHNLKKDGYDKLKEFRKIHWTRMPFTASYTIDLELGSERYVPDVYWNKKSASRQANPDTKHWEIKLGHTPANKPHSKTDYDKKNKKRPRHMKRKRKKL